MHPDDAAQKDERHCGHGHHAVVDITKVVDTVGDNLEAQQAAAPEELAQCSHNHQNHGVAQTVGHSVEEAGPRLVLHGKRLKTPHIEVIKF